MIADRNLYLDKTSSRLVAEGSAESAFQLINAGREIPDEEVERLGLYLDKDRKVAQKGAAPEKAPSPAAPAEPAAKKAAPKRAKKSSGKK